MVRHLTVLPAAWKEALHMKRILWIAIVAALAVQPALADPGQGRNDDRGARGSDRGGGAAQRGDRGRGSGSERGRGGAPVRGHDPGPIVSIRGYQRAPVYIQRGFPLRRPLRVVVRRRPFVFASVFYGPTIAFSPHFVSLPQDRLTWEDSQVLYRQDDWTEVDLNVNGPGGRLYLELTDATQLDWAEVVFDDGGSSVVDFHGNVQRPGIYSLIGFRDGRYVTYVRVIARAVAPRSELILHLAR
jgi:hypothetical protein